MVNYTNIGETLMRRVIFATNKPSVQAAGKGAKAMAQDTTHFGTNMWRGGDGRSLHSGSMVEDILTSGGGGVRPADRWRPSEMARTQKREGRKYSWKPEPGEVMPMAPSNTPPVLPRSISDYSDYGRMQGPKQPPPPSASSSSTPPINKVASTNAPIKPQWSAWGAVPATMIAGGMTANLFSSEENRGLGTFAKGALFGAGGGLGMHMAMGSKIMSGTTGALARAAKRGGNETAISWAGGAHRAAVMAQSANSRAVAWGAGAMLAGTLGGSSRSKAHGINANRGNRFGG